MEKQIIKFKCLYDGRIVTNGVGGRPKVRLKQKKKRSQKNHLRKLK